ncbi:MAG TPA: 2Fe-2S iron-sulfur cluster-binding protein [Pyrinomonadaceae bacterium]
MPKITAETATGTVEFECGEGRKLVLCIEDNGIDILHRCGGNARCTTCRVEVIEGDFGPMGEAEEAILATKGDLGPNTRLSCQIRVNADAHVEVINQASVKGIDPGTRPEE